MSGPKDLLLLCEMHPALVSLQSHSPLNLERSSRGFCSQKSKDALSSAVSLASLGDGVGRRVGAGAAY